MTHSPGFLALVNDAKSRVKEVLAPDLPAILAGEKAALLIDVREDNEWAVGHVRGAVHLGKGIIERDIEAAQPDKARPMYLYCGGGFRSALVADALQKMGYTRVYSVDGGWKALKGLMAVEG